MVSLVYTSLPQFSIGFLSEEIEQIVELKKEIIARKPLENIRMHHIAYQNKWYPLFDLQKIFAIPHPSPVRYAIMIKNTAGNILCGICTPNPVEEISVSEKNILPFPTFLLEKQSLCLLYAYVQTNNLCLFLGSLTDIWHPIAIAKYLLHTTPLPSLTGGQP
jgi:hypothetical protein